MNVRQTSTSPIRPSLSAPSGACVGACVGACASQPEKLTPRIAAKRASLTKYDIYRLFHAGLLQGERPTPNKIFIYSASLESHLAATRNPEFWDHHSL